LRIAENSDKLMKVEKGGKGRAEGIAYFYKFVRSFIVWDKEVIIKSIDAPSFEKVMY